MQIQRETTIHLPERFYALLEQQLASTNLDDSNLITLNYRDPDYTASSGGYHPVEIGLYRSGHSWQLNYMTDFAYFGRVYPELEKEVDVLFSKHEVYCSFYGKRNLREAIGHVQSLIANFISYAEIGVYHVQVSVD